VDGLRAGRPGFDFRKEHDLSVLNSVQTGYGIYPASYPINNEDDFFGVKRPGREADYSSPFSAEVKNGGAIPPLSHTSSWQST
jgi:hypothetical protein